jgi:hypothetical protein
MGIGGEAFVLSLRCNAASGVYFAQVSNARNYELNGVRQFAAEDV